jgi:hypothetical protein
MCTHSRGEEPRSRGVVLQIIHCDLNASIVGGRYLGENEENRKLIKEGGGIAPLVRTFVASWGAAPELQELACKCLLNLSISPGTSPPPFTILSS